MRLNKTGGVALFIVFALGTRSPRGLHAAGETGSGEPAPGGATIGTVLWPHDQDRAVGMTGETAYCFHSLSGDVDYGICQLTLMSATPQVVERDENCESPKT